MHADYNTKEIRQMKTADLLGVNNQNNDDKLKLREFLTTEEKLNVALKKHCEHAEF